MPKIVDTDRLIGLVLVDDELMMRLGDGDSEDAGRLVRPSCRHGARDSVGGRCEKVPMPLLGVRGRDVQNAGAVAASDAARLHEVCE